MEDWIDLRRYWALFVRWLWLITLCVVLAAGSAYVVSSRQTPIYWASTTLLIQQANSNQLYYQYQYIDQIASTYIQMMTGRPVMEAALARLGWAYAPGRVSATQIRDTQLIQLSVVDVDPVRAATFANTLADVFIAKQKEMVLGRYGESQAAIQTQMDELSQQMEEIQAQIDELGEPANTQEQADLGLLQTTLAGYRNMYTILVRDYEMVQLDAAQADLIAVYEPARIPRFPVGTSRWRNTMLAGTVGALLALGVVFLIEYLDDTIKTSADVKRVLGLSAVGAIVRLKTEDKELIAVNQPLSPASEAFRKLRANIRFSGLDRPLRTLLVTSPNPSEGKSTVASNLAVVMAQAGLKAVALDADLRKPRLHQMFGLHPRGGLTNSLLEGNLDGELQPAQVEGLAVLPAGELPPNPAELLGSRRMQELLESLKQRADVIVIDSPPVLPVADAAVLAQAVDGVLLVLDAGETRRGMALQAVEELRRDTG